MSLRVAVVFDKHREDTIGVYVKRACRQVGVAETHFWTRDPAIPAGYDLYLRVDHGEYHEDLPEPCRPRVFYAMDTHLSHSWKKIRRLAERYDLVCCGQRKAAEALPNGAWVPVACDVELHGRQPRPTRWDVAFVGTEGGFPRKFYLQVLREAYPNSFIRHAPYTELGQIYSQAKIGFNFSIRDDVNMRIFEVLAAGTLLVTNHLPHDDLERLGLRERVHYVAYRRPNELLPLITYYLEHEQERQAIALAGRHHAQQHHTYAHRLRQILTLIGQRVGRPMIATEPREASTPPLEGARTVMRLS